MGKKGESHKIPTIVTMPSIITVSQVVCGSWHTIIRSSEGKLFGWGANDMGQLSFPKQPLVSSPQEIIGTHFLSFFIVRSCLFDWLGLNVKSTLVSCGKDFTLILGEDNIIYSCGNNSSGMVYTIVFFC